MANEKKQMDITKFYAKQEIMRLTPVWEETSSKINELIALEEPDGDTLNEIIKAVDGLKKFVKPMNYMALLLAKQKAFEEFMEEKGLAEEFEEFSMREN